MAQLGFELLHQDKSASFAIIPVCLHTLTACSPRATPALPGIRFFPTEGLQVVVIYIALSLPIAEGFIS